MKSTGIVRKVDNLGRIVLPVELRRGEQRVAPALGLSSCVSGAPRELCVELRRAEEAARPAAYMPCRKAEAQVHGYKIIRAAREARESVAASHALLGGLKYESYRAAQTFARIYKHLCEREADCRVPVVPARVRTPRVDRGEAERSGAVRRSRAFSGLDAVYVEAHGCQRRALSEPRAEPRVLA